MLQGDTCGHAHVCKHAGASEEEEQDKAHMLCLLSQYGCQVPLDGGRALDAIRQHPRGQVRLQPTQAS